MCSFQRIADSLRIDLLILHGSNRAKQFGGHKAVVRPVPIPNTAVKHSLANGSGCIASARVGCRQFFNKNPGEFSSGFLLYALSVSGFYFSIQTQLSFKLFPSRSARASTWFSPGDNIIPFQTNTQFVPSLRSPWEKPFSSSSTLVALE